MKIRSKIKITLFSTPTLLAIMASTFVAAQSVAQDEKPDSVAPTESSRLIMNRGGTSDSTDDEEAVRAVGLAYDVAWNAGDVATMMSLLTDGAVITNPSGDTTVGRDEATSSFTTLMDGRMRGSRHKSELIAVRFVKSDVALVDGMATISNIGEYSEPLRHHYTDVLVRTSDGWRIDQIRAYVFMQPPD
jgi:uncharacterized protein (TIGR02246 family)